jgi:L-alanine-DL-glutamate epimerase-like enolase superfamily enzyme
MNGLVSTASAQAALVAGALIPDVMRGLANRDPLMVSSVAIAPLEGRLSQPFVIASDASKQERVDNVLVALEFGDGTVGFGEAAPYAGISGDSCEILWDEIRSSLIHLCDYEMTPYSFACLLRDVVRYPAARAALETAFLDAHAKRLGLSLCKFLSPRIETRPFITDITIPIVGTVEAARLAGKYREEGFERIKIKVGDDLDSAFDRVEAIVGAYAAGGLVDGLEVLLDANEGYDATDAIGLLDFMQSRLGVVPEIFEQPVRRDDIEGMRQVRIVASAFGTRVFADESVFTCYDAIKLIEADAADGINLKIMKHGGIIETLKIAERAIHAGLQLMIGGMVETQLAMTASLHLAQLIDPVWLDLDTPLLMETLRLRGGMVYEGAQVMLPQESGIGVHPLSGI